MYTLLTFDAYVPLDFMDGGWDTMSVWITDTKEKLSKKDLERILRRALFGTEITKVQNVEVNVVNSLPANDYCQWIIVDLNGEHVDTATEL